jgi:putative phage-type endonuclease
MDIKIQMYLMDILSENPFIICEPKYLSLLDKKMKAKCEEVLYNEWIINKIELLKSINYERSSESYFYEGDKYNLIEHLDYLSRIDQPIQKTQEWYTFRYNHITASNAWKSIGTESSKNQLIYEKCIPLCIEKYGPSLKENAMTWGHKYEPLTISIYEYKNNTKISDFGCIEHSKYNFLAASPDGIVTGPNNTGRMIEIKNVVSREITGIPKKDYYIQMQLQMEVCDLNECDFVETKFIEFTNYDDYMNARNELNKNESIDNNKKENNDPLFGVMVMFIKNGDSYHYEYIPIDYKEDHFGWIQETIRSNTSESLVWFRNIYWKLDLYSCVLVKRNKELFKSCIVEIENTWNIIKEERMNGEYEKRAPRKRVKKNTFTCIKILDNLLEMSEDYNDTEQLE